MRLFGVDPPPSGNPRRARLRFVLHDGLALLLVCFQHGRLPRWYTGLGPQTRVEIAIDGARYLGIVEAAGSRDLDTDDVIALFRDKYGMQLVKVWYESVTCRPVVVRVIERLPGP